MNTHRIERRGGAGARGWLHLAAAPTFAIMAWVTATAGDDPARMLCQAMGHGWLSPDGMSFMYLLMAIFHASPWWKWIVLRIRGHTRAGKGRARESAIVDSR